MNDEVATGDFVGHWYREGAVLTMHNIVQINDGSHRILDVITFDAAKNELLVKAYILTSSIYAGLGGLGTLSRLIHLNLVWLHITTHNVSPSINHCFNSP